MTVQRQTLVDPAFTTRKRVNRYNGAPPRTTIDRDAGLVIVQLADGTTASAKCHPDDEFNYDLGYELALGRALKKQAAQIYSDGRFLVRDAYAGINRRNR